MSDVPAEMQGTQARARRGKELHDKVLAGKSISPEQAERGGAAGKPQAFCFGAKTTSGVFSRPAHVGDNIDNKKLARRVAAADQQHQSEERNKILAGPFKVHSNIHRPFHADMYVYNHSEHAGPDKLPAFSDKLRGTRFSKSRTDKEPWRPNHPAKRGYNMTINKQHHYHQTLHYRPKEEPKLLEEKIWIPNYRGTLEKPQPAQNRFYRNGRTRLRTDGIDGYQPRTQLLG